MVAQHVPCINIHCSTQMMQHLLVHDIGDLTSALNMIAKSVHNYMSSTVCVSSW